MTFRHLKIGIVATFASLALGLTVSAQNVSSADTLKQARALLQGSQSREALKLLEPLRDSLSGTTQFDYTLALALVDSGEYSEAILVFDRLLGNNPDFHGARLDLARAYLGNGELDKASSQLDLLEDTSPPAKALARINVLRAAIHRQGRSLRFSRFLSVRTDAGYDSNVNSATVVSEFLGFELDEQSREQGSSFYEAGINGGVRYKLSRRLAFFAGAGAQHRSNSQADFVDSTVLTMNTGAVRSIDGERQTLVLSAYTLNVDGNSNSRGINLGASWMRPLTDLWQVGITGDIGAIRYRDDLEVKDVNRGTVGVVFDGLFGRDNRGLVGFRLGYGLEDPTSDSSRYSRDFTFGAASLGWQFNTTLSSRFSLYYQDSHFDEIFFQQFYGEPRKDRLYRALASVSWQFLPKWRLTPTLTYTRNDTFVDIFEYERFEAKVRINYIFQ